jgi:hypothetical protein
MSERIAALRGKPDPARIERLATLIEEVVDRLEEGGDAAPLVAEINRLSGCSYEPMFFDSLHGWTSVREAAEVAAKGAAPTAADLTRDELVEIVGIIEEGDEPEASFFVDFLDRKFPGSWTTDLLFHPHREMTAEETVDELLLRESLHRTGGWEAVNAHIVALARGTLADPAAPFWAKQWAKGMAGARD